MSFLPRFAVGLELIDMVDTFLSEIPAAERQ
jgi:hypothetical protein